MIRRWRRPLLVLALSLAACIPVAIAARAPRDPRPLDLAAPIAVYSDSPAYGEAVAINPVGESTALRELNELVRLKKSGLRIDYDLIPASSFVRGGFRALRAQDWPNGLDVWIGKCRDAGIRPGIEIGVNTLPSIQLVSDIPQQWKDSLSRDGHGLSLSEGGFLPDLISALQFWYDRGIRLFRLGPIDLAATTPASAARLTANEIVAHNSTALRDALTAFRRKNRDAVVLLLIAPPAVRDSSASTSANNDLSVATAAPRPELSQLGAFQLLSTGEPQPSSAPQANVARVIDIEDDSRVRRFEKLGVPLQHIDSTGFVVSRNDNPGLRQPLRAWKGAFLHSMARGGWVNGVNGDIERIRSVDAIWMARAQKLFFTLQAQGRIRSFGGPLSGGKPYGFAATTQRGSIYVVVNPGLTVAPLALPLLPTVKSILPEGRIQFRDAGFKPRLRGATITLGPGQMAMIGYGAYAGPAFNFGVQQDVVIPNSIEPVDADFQSTAPTTIEARINPPIEGVLRIVVHEREPLSQSSLSDAGIADSEAPANSGISIEVTQSGRPIPVRLDGDESKTTESPGAGPLWLVAEIDVNDLTPGIPVSVRFHSNATTSSDLEGSAYAVVY